MFGWCYEVFLEVVVYHWGFSNRGVLFGPYCPVYGVGALLFLLLFYRLIQGKPWKQRLLWLPLLFVGCMVSATLVGAGRLLSLPGTDRELALADLCHYRYHFQGRIALSPSIRFGLGGLFFLYVLQPLLDRGLAALSPPGLGRLAALLAVLMGIDLVFLVGTFFLTGRHMDTTVSHAIRGFHGRLPSQLPDPGLRIAVRQQGGFSASAPGRWQAAVRPLPGPYRLVQRPSRQRPSPDVLFWALTAPGRWVHRPSRAPFFSRLCTYDRQTGHRTAGPFWIPWPPR